jgi:lipocalin
MGGMDLRTTNRLLLLATAVLFSTGGAAIKAASFTGWQVASFRSAIAAVALVALLPAARKAWSWRVLLVGCAYAATLILFVLSTKLTTAANAIFLQSAAPLYVLLLSPWLLREPIRRRDLGFALAVASGLALFFAGRETAVATAPDPLRGNLLAALSGVAWALTLMGLRWLGKGQGSAAVATVVAGNVIAALAALPLALPVASVEWKGLAVLLYLGLVQIGLAYFCLTRAIPHVPAFEASALLLLEPALNPVWTWLVHGERPSAWALSGGALILGATLFHTWRLSRAGPDRPAPEVAPAVDLARYAGKWHEIARLPNRFQRRCDGAATATYALRPDGRITVVNECRRRDGRLAKVAGTARVAVRGGPNSKLKVSFFRPFWGDYWILDLDPGYGWALVGEPRRKYLWILSRTPHMDEALALDILARAKDRGYDLADLLWTGRERS